MELFDKVFDAISIRQMLIFNIKAVLEHPTLEDLKINNPALYECWKHISKTKYGIDVDGKYYDLTGEFARENLPYPSQKIYNEKAVYHSEFCRIVAITYTEPYLENGGIKRPIKKIAYENECLVIANFMDILLQLSLDGVNSTPKYFPSFCGHNIMNYDIPLLIKRYILHRSEFDEPYKQLPFILKRCLSAKPWESVIIDTANVWKFNGGDYASLMLIADYLKLKKTVDLMTLPDISKYYWDNVKEKPEQTLEHIALQSANQTNLVFQLIHELRQL